MHAHISNMLRPKEKLAEIGMLVDDDSFNLHTQTSPHKSLSYNPLLTILSANSCIKQRKCTTTFLVSFDEALPWSRRRWGGKIRKRCNGSQNGKGRTIRRMGSPVLTPGGLATPRSHAWRKVQHRTGGTRSAKDKKMPRYCSWRLTHTLVL